MMTRTTTPFFKRGSEHPGANLAHLRVNLAPSVGHIGHRGAIQRVSCRRRFLFVRRHRSEAFGDPYHSMTSPVLTPSTWRHLWATSGHLGAIQRVSCQRRSFVRRRRSETFGSPFHQMTSMVLTLFGGLKIAHLPVTRIHHVALLKASRSL